MTKPIRVLIVDDQPLMRDGLEMLLGLSPDIECVGVAGDGDAAIEQYQLLKPDVVLMDIEMPNKNGIEATRAIKRLDIDARILVLTTFGQSDYVEKALREGAQGFLLKAVESDTLLAHIRAVMQGTSVLDEYATQVLLDSYRGLTNSAHTGYGDPLSQRELEVLRLIAIGKTNQLIAQKLNLATGTIKNYVSQILDKLSASDRADAVRIAKESKLI